MLLNTVPVKARPEPAVYVVLTFVFGVLIVKLGYVPETVVMPPPDIETGDPPKSLVIVVPLTVMPVPPVKVTLFAALPLNAVPCTVNVLDT